jgi:hypothetical protein
MMPLRFLLCPGSRCRTNTTMIAATIIPKMAFRNWPEYEAGLRGAAA